MNIFLICIVLVLVGVLVGIYFRLSPLEALSDETKARQGLDQSRAETVATEGEALLRGLRALIQDLAETVHLERGTANERQSRLDATRAITEMFRLQLDAVSGTLSALLESVHLERGIADERQARLETMLIVSEKLGLQLDAARCALESLLLEVDAELSTVIDALSREYTPERAKRILESINNSRAKRADAMRRGTTRAEHIERDSEETRPEGISAERIVRRSPRSTGTQEDLALTEEPAALAGVEHLGRLRTPKVLTTPEGIEEPRKLLAATAPAAGEVDEEDSTATQVFDKATTTAALGAGAGGATPTPKSAPRAIHSGSVAPPASAPPPLPPRAGIIAAGLGLKPTTSTYGVDPPAPCHDTTPLPAMSPTLPGATLKNSGLPFAKTMASMPAQPASRPANPARSWER